MFETLWEEFCQIVQRNYLQHQILHCRKLRVAMEKWWRQTANSSTHARFENAKLHDSQMLGQHEEKIRKRFSSSHCVERFCESRETISDFRRGNRVFHFPRFSPLVALCSRKMLTAVKQFFLSLKLSIPTKNNKRHRWILIFPQCCCCSNTAAHIWLISSPFLWALVCSEL